MDYTTACRVLGLTPPLTEAGVTAAFRAKAQVHHPDKPGGDAVLFAQITQARDFLRMHNYRSPIGVGPGRTPPPPIDLQHKVPLSVAMFGGSVAIPIPALRPCAVLISHIMGYHPPTCQCRGTGWIQSSGGIPTTVVLRAGEGIHEPITITTPTGGPIRVWIQPDGEVVVSGRVYYAKEGFDISHFRPIYYPRYLLGGPLHTIDPWGTPVQAILPPGRFPVGEEDLMSISEPIPGSGIPSPDGRGSMVVVGLPLAPEGPPSKNVESLLWRLQRELHPTDPDLPESYRKKPRKPRKKGTPDPT